MAVEAVVEAVVKAVVEGGVAAVVFTAVDNGGGWVGRCAVAACCSSSSSLYVFSCPLLGLMMYVRPTLEQYDLYLRQRGRARESADAQMRRNESADWLAGAALLGRGCSRKLPYRAPSEQVIVP